MLLALLLLLPLSVFSDEVCNEWTFDFEEPSGNPEHVSGGWYQNKSGNFKPFGVVEILDAPFATSKKAVKLSSTEKSTDVVTRTMIPVQAGDTLQLTILFRSANGTDNARVGLYGYNDKGGLNDYQAVEFLALNTEWDLRQTCFEINDHSVTKVSFFVAAKANQSMIYSFLRVKKLSSEEAFLITPKNAAGLWYQHSKGNNLALKQKVTFIPEPNYELTRKGGTDLTDLTDGTTSWGTPLRGHLTDLDTQGLAAQASAAAAQTTADDAATAAAGAQSDATQALADAAAAQATADAASAVTGVGVTVSGNILVATTSTPAGMVAGDLIVVVP